MRGEDHRAINVRFFISNPSGTYDPVELLNLDMINAAVAPGVGDLVYENVRSNDPQVYRVVSRQFDPQNMRIGIMVKKVDAVDNSPFL